MALYVTTAFSPSMLTNNVVATVVEITQEEFAKIIHTPDIIPAVGHENTANIIAKKFNISKNLYNRTNITLYPNDIVLVAIPQFRADQSREFTDKEIMNSQFRYFIVNIQ